MCIYNDDWSRWLPAPYVPPPPYVAPFGPPALPPLVSPAELDKLRELLEKAKAYDELTGQPDCELEEKKERLRQLAAKMGVCHRAVMYKVKDWCKAGRVEYAGRRRVVNITGGISCIPVYRLKQEEK